MKLKINGKLKLEVLPNGRWCELIDAVQVVIDDEQLIVPVGFQTDFASVPKIFWHIISPMGLHTMAAVIHDYLYNSHRMSKPFADRIFYELMLFYGVGRIKAKVMYLAVKWFGGRAWRNQ